MRTIENVDWFTILCREAAVIEKKANICIDIDEAIVLEVDRLVREHLLATGLQHPNVAKVAGQVMFWVGKLKPLRLSADSPNSLLTLNELAGLRIGLAICNAYRDDSSKGRHITLPPRIGRDWVSSLRYDYHSPHSSMLSFELLMCDA